MTSFFENNSSYPTGHFMPLHLSRRKLFATLAGICAVAVGAGLGSLRLFEQPGHEGIEFKPQGSLIELPSPITRGTLSIEEAIAGRRSRRAFTSDPVMLRDISQLCWAAQGVTERTTNLRAAPSAGALYPVELFLVVGNSDLEQGVYRYDCAKHALGLVKGGDYRNHLREASLDQECVGNGALDFVITGVFDRTTIKYGERGGQRYVPMEAGHIAENIYLMAEALGLGTVSVGAFQDDRVQEVISAPSTFIPLYVMPIGHVR
jgi:SagB-type dehydrogenase family enzyme